MPLLYASCHVVAGGHESVWYGWAVWYGTVSVAVAFSNPGTALALAGLRREACASLFTYEY